MPSPPARGGGHGRSWLSIKLVTTMHLRSWINFSVSSVIWIMESCCIHTSLLSILLTSRTPSPLMGLTAWRSWQWRQTTCWTFLRLLLQLLTPLHEVLICALLLSFLHLQPARHAWMRILPRINLRSTSWDVILPTCMTAPAHAHQCHPLCSWRSGKGQIPPALPSAVGGPATLLEVTDHCFGQVFLSRAEADCTSTLCAANGTRINTYGHVTHTVHSDRHQFTACLFITDVKYSLLGADFLWEHLLLVGLLGDWLLLPVLLTSIPCSCSNHHSCSEPDQFPAQCLPPTLMGISVDHGSDLSQCHPSPLCLSSHRDPWMACFGPHSPSHPRKTPCDQARVHSPAGVEDNSSFTQ